MNIPSVILCTTQGRIKTVNQLVFLKAVNRCIMLLWRQENSGGNAGPRTCVISCSTQRTCLCIPTVDYGSRDGGSSEPHISYYTPLLKRAQIIQTALWSLGLQAGVVETKGSRLITVSATVEEQQNLERLPPPGSKAWCGPD